jgi:hypothetical protein
MKQPKSWHADCCSDYLEVVDQLAHALDRILEEGLATATDDGVEDFSAAMQPS